jgi:hypothetical protein
VIANTFFVKVTDWLNVLGRMSIDTYSENQQQRVAVVQEFLPILDLIEVIKKKL